jgi:serine/threonine-protein kinase
MANSPARAPIDVGTVIADTYTIEALIGQGGMGSVFLASHVRLPGKHVAIKVLHIDLGQDEILARFRREAEIASQLGHPNIVDVHDSNTMPDGTPYLVLEYLEGENLAQRIGRGPIALADTLAIVGQIASALAAAHKAGIVHRDLKPQNVFLVQTEVAGATIEVVKVLDFGISKIMGSQTVKTQDSAMLGTPQYMAPEQATGKHTEVDERTDLFALGSMIYEMLSGQPAFAGASVPEVVFKVVYEEPTPLGERMPGLDPAVAAAVHRALAKKPADRFRTVTELVEALTGRPVSLVRPPRGRGRATGATDAGTAKTSSSSQAALANTVGSGDHGSAPMAVADTVASGDHRDSRPAVGTGPDVERVLTAPPPVATAPPPVAGRPRRLWIFGIGAVAVVAAIAIGYAVTRGNGDGDRRTPAATGPQPAAATDAPTVAVVAADAARADAAAIATGATVDAATAADATDVASRSTDARVGPSKSKPDATTSADPPTSPEADKIYDDGTAALKAGDPQRAAERGRILTDRHSDLRGWVLIGAAACQRKQYSDLTSARARLRGHKKLAAKLARLCPE